MPIEYKFYYLNSKLHRLIKEANHLDEILAYIAQTDPKTLDKMVRIVDDQGYIPIKLVKKSKLSKEEKNILYKILFALTTAHQYKPITQWITEEKLQKTIKKYDIKPNSQLHRNLEKAFDLVNTVRCFEIKSNTHPSVNNTTSVKKKCLEYAIAKMRNKAETECIFDSQKNENDYVAELSLRRNKGNCHEYTAVVMSFAKEMWPDIHITRGYISSGDHIFPVLGENDDRVVADAWAGKVYPLFAHHQELKSCDYLPTAKSFKNICTFYNPNFFTAFFGAKQKKPQVDQTIPHNIDKLCTLK